jgi:hypothetical protein
VWSSPYTGWNKTHETLVGSSIVQTMGNIKKSGSGASLAREEGMLLSRVNQPGAWPSCGLPLHWL